MMPGARGTPLAVFPQAPVGPSRAHVVIVHGFQEHADQYLELAAECLAAGLGVTRFDLRGHGRSGGRRGDVEGFDAFLEDLDRVWEAGPDQGPRFLLGHSLGGLIALRWAQTRPERLAGLVVSAPWLGTAFTVGPVKRTLRALLERIAPGLPIPQSLDPADLTRDPDRQAAHRTDRLKHQRVTARLVGVVEETQRQVLAQAVPAATLFIVPEADPIADARLSLEYVSGLDSRPDLIRYPEGRHEPFQDLEREDVIARVVHWIASRST